MSFATEANAIRSRFSTEWGATTSIAWPNVAFTPTTGTAWVRLSILPSGADQAEIGVAGSRTFRHDGTVLIEVFVPENSGDGQARTYAEQAAAIFRGVTAGGVRYGAPHTVTNGNDGAGWFVVSVWCPYMRDTRY